MQFLEDGPNNNGGRLWYDTDQLPKSLIEMLCGVELIVNPMNCNGWLGANRMIGSIPKFMQTDLIFRSWL